MGEGSRAARERRRRRARRKRIIAGVATGVVVAGVGSGVGIALSSDSGPSYRVARAGEASVNQTVTSVGTVGTVDTSTVSFPVSGTVSKVDVAIGDQVSGGETLATLDTTSLRQDVNSANASLAAAKQTLASDEDAQSSSSSSASSSSSSDGSSGASSLVSPQSAAEQPIDPSPSTTPSSSPHASPSHSTGSAGATKASSTKLEQAVRATQNQVRAAQAALDKELGDLGADLRALTASSGGCAARPAEVPAQISYPTTAGQDGTISGTAGDDDTVTLFDGDSQVGDAQHGAYSFTQLTPAASYKVKIQPATPADSVDASSCSAAIASIIAKYTSGSADGADSYLTTLSSALTSAERDLTTAVANLSAVSSQHPSAVPSGAGSRSTGKGTSSGTRSGSVSHGSATSSNSGRTPGGSANRGGSGNTASGGSPAAGSGSGAPRGTGREITAEQLAADQAAIDAAQAQVSVTEQNLAQGTLTTPIAGTVAAVDLDSGDTVGASSTTSTVTIIGQGAKQVTTTVGLSDIDRVKVGDRARVTVDGVTAPLTGKVSSIGVLDTTTGSTTSYPVDIVLDPASAKLYDGSGASVSIVVAEVSGVLTVPSSAIHRTGGLSTVTVLRNGKTSIVRVGVGAVGADLTQITSGLSAGDQVVLADLGEPLPSSGSDTSNNGLLGNRLNGGGTFRRFGTR